MGIGQRGLSNAGQVNRATNLYDVLHGTGYSRALDGGSRV